MKTVKGFARFWYDFVIGDDWVIAVGVVAAIGATWLLARHVGAAWLVMPVAVAVLLGLSLARAQRGARAAAGSDQPDS